MLQSRLTIGKVALAWVMFLSGAALILPNLDSRAHANPAGKAIVVVGYITLLIGTPIALTNYFNRAWRRVGTITNTTVYVIWLSLESIAAVAFLGLVAYPAIVFAVARLR
jgi:hypothetical protein